MEISPPVGMIAALHLCYIPVREGRHGLVPFSLISFRSVFPRLSTVSTVYPASRGVLPRYNLEYT